MWRDWDDWGENEAGYVVTFRRDRCTINPAADPPLAVFLDPANYVPETRYIYIRAEIVADTTDLEKAATFGTRAAATEAIQKHRAEMGDVGRIYEITPLS